MIAEYEDENRMKEFDAPRVYGLTQQHKHLKEMKAITGLNELPLFSPIVADYYSGMLVTLPLYTSRLNGSQNVESIRQCLVEHYEGQRFIQVMPAGAEDEYKGLLAGNSLTGFDGLRIYVTGNDDRIVLSAQFDNLGKGASGAAIQCLNIVLGCEEEKGLEL